MDVICLECSGLVKACEKALKRDIIEVLDSESRKLIAKEVNFTENFKNKDKSGSPYYKCNLCNRKIGDGEDYIFKDDLTKFRKKYL